MMVPEKFTLAPVDVIVPTTPEEPQDYTTALIPLTVQQYNFMTTTVTTEQDQVQKIPGCIMDCIGYISWFIHQGHESTVDLGTFSAHKLSLRTAELFQKVYEKRITVFKARVHWTGFTAAPGVCMEPDTYRTGVWDFLQAHRTHHQPVRELHFGQGLHHLSAHHYPLF